MGPLGLTFGLMVSQSSGSGPSSIGDGQKAGQIRVVALPSRPFIERRGGQQLINFDLLVENSAQKPYRLVCIRLMVYDRSGRLELERELNENGRPPALDMVGERLLKPGGAIDIYQPFYSFGPEIDASRMRFELRFMEQAHSAPPVAITADEISVIDVKPRAYYPSGYRLPVHGLVLVHDGHDFYSHHRRYNLVKRFQGGPDTALSANLYAYDLINVKEDGALFQGDPTKRENWLTYGAPIFAPAPGIVVEAVSDVAENTFAADGEAQIPASAAAQDPLGLGNHLKILHSDGRVSWLLHLQPGSVQIKAGAHVRSGQFLARVGFSGDSLFPHLHFNVTDCAQYPSQGVPSYFKNFRRVLGSRTIPVLNGEIDTGDVIRE